MTELNKNGGTLMLSDAKGNPSEQIKYETANKFFAGFAPIKIEGKWYLIDQKSHIWENALPYDDIRDFSEGFAVVMIKGSLGRKDKYGYLDYNYKEFTPIVYDEAQDFTDGYGAVKKGGKSGWIDINGKFLTQKPKI